MSDYLNELRDSARQVVEGTGTPALEEATWPLIVELGWLLTAVPESLDGLGLGLEELCALQTELGKGLSQAAFLPAIMAVDALCHSDLADKADWIGRFTMGEVATAPLAQPQIKAQQNVLSGRSEAVQSADKASHLLLWTNDQQCLVLVALEQSGVELVERKAWDTTRRLFDVTLNNVALDQQLVIAQGDAARKLITRVQVLRDFGLAADSLGGSVSILDITVEHLCTRKQFGRPLALFQALKHRCADLKTIIAAAEALLNSSLQSLGDDLDSDEALLAAKEIKYLASDVYSKVTEESLQLHGGIGMASEYPCHHYLKRAMLGEHLGSDNDDSKLFIAEQFLKKLA